MLSVLVMTVHELNVLILIVLIQVLSVFILSLMSSFGRRYGPSGLKLKLVLIVMILTGLKLVLILLILTVLVLIVLKPLLKMALIV